MSDPLTEAREALARPWWHPDCGSIVDVVHLRSALAAVDELTAERDRLQVERDNMRGGFESCVRLATWTSNHREALDYDGCGLAGDEAIVLMQRLMAERDRLRDVLRCERGEWAPEGWRWFTDGGFWRRREQLAEVTRLLHAGDGWEMISGYESKGEYPTALEAIEAADLAAGSKP